MNKETIRELRERADGMITAGIANKDALFAALPLLTKLQAKAESARKNLAASVKALTMLSELCSRYALAHESVFEKKRLITNQQGVRTGDIVTDEATSAALTPRAGRSASTTTASESSTCTTTRSRRRRR